MGSDILLARSFKQNLVLLDPWNKRVHVRFIVSFLRIFAECDSACLKF